MGVKLLQQLNINPNYSEKPKPQRLTIRTATQTPFHLANTLRSQLKKHEASLFNKVTIYHVEGNTYSTLRSYPFAPRISIDLIVSKGTKRKRDEFEEEYCKQSHDDEELKSATTKALLEDKASLVFIETLREIKKIESGPFELTMANGIKFKKV